MKEANFLVFFSCLSWYTTHQNNSFMLSVSHSRNDTEMYVGHMDQRKCTRKNRLGPYYYIFQEELIFFFSLKLFSSRKQYASLTDNVLHFWESSVGPFFSLPPAQSFVLKTPKCNEVTWSKHDAVFQNNKAF